MKARLIPKSYIEKAYTKSYERPSLELEPSTEKLDLLPNEIFEILGEVIGFIERTNILEGDKNENKQ